MPLNIEQETYRLGARVDKHIAGADGKGQKSTESGQEWDINVYINNCYTDILTIKSLTILTINMVCKISVILPSNS